MSGVITALSFSQSQLCLHALSNIFLYADEIHQVACFIKTGVVESVALQSCLLFHFWQFQRTKHRPSRRKRQKQQQRRTT